MELSKEQLGFISWFNSQGEGVYVLTGHAGSGKTTVMGELSKGIDALWCAPSHQAKNVLAKRVKRGHVTTIASALGLRPVSNYGGGGGMKFMPCGKDLVFGRDVVVFDETSAINNEHLQWILDKRIKKILMVGDPKQLPPVKSLKSPVFEQGYPTFHLTKIFRQSEGSPILDFATDIRETGNKDPGRHGIKCVFANEGDVMEFFRRYPDGIAVCPSHQEKEYVNRIARGLLSGGKLRPEDKFLQGERLLLESPIEPPKGPQNGDIITIIDDPRSVMFQGFHVWEMIVTAGNDVTYNIRVPNDEPERKAIAKKSKELSSEYRKCGDGYRKGVIEREMDVLASITLAGHGYSITIHKAQGSTYTDVLFLTGGMRFFKGAELKKRMAYTAVTRASENLILCEGVI